MAKSTARRTGGASGTGAWAGGTVRDRGGPRGGRGRAGGGRRSGGAPGADAFRRGVLTGAGAALAVAALVAVVVWAPLGGSAEERLREASAQRDREQVVALTTAAKATVADIAGVVEEMAEPPADAAQAGAWSAALTAAAAVYDDPPSGETATNVARGSLAAALDLLVEAAATAEVAAGLDGAERAAVAERAAAQRDLAVRVWSVGATQLDAVNVAAGNGHQHAFLPAGPGALTPDGAREGQGATAPSG